jgi:FemAB-related protein (PEP-CTERM system-associated)
MSLRVAEFDGPPATWDDFARGYAGWSFCHWYGWKRVMEDVLGHQCLYLAARDEFGGLRGVLPLVRVRSAIFGHYLVSMPFLNYGGPLGSPEAIGSLAGHATSLAQAGRVKLLELRSRIPLPLDLPVSHRKITVVLDLPAQAEQLWSSLGSKLRSQVKRPQKENVEVRFGPDQVEPFFAVFSEHMRDLGTPTLPRALFEAVAQTFGESAWFGCAYHQGRPVAGGAGFRWENEFEMTWAASLSAYNAIAPNMLLYWSFMERAVADRSTLFNFGRCSPGVGTHRFKRQWGSRDEPLWWYQRGAEAASTPSPDDPAFAWGPRIWRRLPLPIATALGPRIVRLIP